VEKDIVVEVAKRTGREVIDQISETPFVVVPFALCGLIWSSWTSIVVVTIIILAFIVYDQYKEIINEIETSIKEAAYAQQQPEAAATPAEPVAQADADVTKVSEETK